MKEGNEFGRWVTVALLAFTLNYLLIGDALSYLFSEILFRYNLNSHVVGYIICFVVILILSYILIKRKK